MKFDELSVQLEHRPYEDTGGGAHKTEVWFLSFVVNGASLHAIVNQVKPEAITPLAHTRPFEERKQYVERLLLREPADLPDNRRSLYGCPECSDIHCGTVTVLVEETDDGFSWRDFALEDNIDEPNFGKLKGLGPFTFAKGRYAELLEGAATDARLNVPAR